MNRSEAWHFLIPDHLRQEEKLLALPFSAEQQRILDELDSKRWIQSLFRLLVRGWNAPLREASVDACKFSDARDSARRMT